MFVLERYFCHLSLLFQSYPSFFHSQLFYKKCANADCCHLKFEVNFVKMHIILCVSLFQFSSLVYIMNETDRLLSSEIYDDS